MFKHVLLCSSIAVYGTTETWGSTGFSRAESVTSGRSSRAYSRYENPYGGYVFEVVEPAEVHSLGLGADKPLGSSGEGRVWLKGTHRDQAPRYFEAELLEGQSFKIRVPSGYAPPTAEGKDFTSWLAAVRHYMSGATVEIHQSYRLMDGEEREECVVRVRGERQDLGHPTLIEVNPRLESTQVHIQTALEELAFTYSIPHVKVHEGPAGRGDKHLVIEGGILGVPAYRLLTYKRPVVLSGDVGEGVWESLLPLTEEGEWHDLERSIEPLGALAFDLTLLAESEEVPCGLDFPQSLLLISHATTQGRGYIHVDNARHKVYATQTTEALVQAAYGEGRERYRLYYTQSIPLSLTLKDAEGLPDGLYEVYGDAGLNLWEVDKTHTVNRTALPREVGSVGTLNLEAGLTASQVRDGLKGLALWWGDMTERDKVPLRQEKALLDVFPEVGLRDVLPLRLGYFPRKPAIPLPSSLWELTLTGFTLDDTLAAQIGAMGGLTQLTLDKMTGSDSAFARALGSDALCHVSLSGSVGIGPLTRGRVAALYPRLRAEGGGTFTPHNGDEWVVLCDGAVGLTPAVKEWLLSHGDKEATTGPGAKRRGDVEARGGRWVKALERYEFAFRKGLEGTVGSLIADILWEGKTGVAAQKGRAVDLYERYGTPSQKIEAAYALMEGDGLSKDVGRAEVMLRALYEGGRVKAESAYALASLYTQTGDETKASHYFKQAIFEELTHGSLTESM